MSTPNDKEIDYMVGQQIVRARSYEAACKKATQPQEQAQDARAVIARMEAKA